LVPGIHEFHGRRTVKSWMPGTSPAKTERVVLGLQKSNCFALGMTQSFRRASRGSVTRHSRYFTPSRNVCVETVVF
ncbi:hypothetical protein, partial [Streptococcus pneumoniae]|uniref:hypothetical protein n=1 Tax=Streptococcus pneumoniae TaxID=1313 RepID=UPI001954AD8C